MAWIEADYFNHSLQGFISAMFCQCYMLLIVNSVLPIPSNKTFSNKYPIAGTYNKSEFLWVCFWESVYD